MDRTLHSNARGEALTASSSSEIPQTPHNSSDTRRTGTSSLSSQASCTAGSFPSLRLGQEASWEIQANEGDQSAKNPHGYWPRPDSDDSDDADFGRPLMRSATKTSGKSTSRFFRSIVQRFGRTFNKQYDFLPNDQVEKDRNKLQHQIFRQVYDGRLHLAPVTNPSRVLDIGTGPGTWALEFAKMNPGSFVLGIDVEAVQTSESLPNCHFQVMDATGQWSFAEKFDFIHVRMLGDLNDRAQLFGSIYDNLSPGGWVEISEWVMLLQSPDHSTDNTAFNRWNCHLRDGLKVFGKTVFYPLDYKRALNGAGFSQVVTRKHPVPINSWPPGKQLKKIGDAMTTNILTVIDMISLPIFTIALGWSQEALERLLVDVRKEVGDTRLHSFMTLLTFYCQKPSDDSYPTIDF